MPKPRSKKQKRNQSKNEFKGIQLFLIQIELKYNVLSGEFEPSAFGETKRTDYDRIKQTVKKKNMLDLMTQNALSSRKKRIIKTYGSEMIAEMYLDLMNITLGRKMHSPRQNIDDENPQENNLSDYVENEDSIFNTTKTNPFQHKKNSISI